MSAVNCRSVNHWEYFSLVMHGSAYRLICMYTHSTNGFASQQSEIKMWAQFRHISSRKTTKSNLNCVTLLFSLVVVSTILYHINKHPAAMSKDGSQPDITLLLAGVRKVWCTPVWGFHPVCVTHDWDQYAANQGGGGGGWIQRASSVPQAWVCYALESSCELCTHID